MSRILLIILGLVLFVILVIWFLMATSTPTFTVEQLQQTVQQAVNDFHAANAAAPVDPVTQRTNAANYFDPEILRDGQISDETLIEAYETERMLDFIHKRFLEAFPGKILHHSKWAWQNTGGVYARQRVLMCNPCEYLCIWGTPLAQGGSSGFYGERTSLLGTLDEGDVMICGKVQSVDPESRLAAPRTYEFGDTSFLKPGRRRHYTMDANTYMVSFGLHGSNLIRTFWPGVIAPYLFVNQDTKSAKIMIGDAMKSSWMWLRDGRGGSGHHDDNDFLASAPPCNCADEEQAFLNEHETEFRKDWKQAGIQCWGKQDCVMKKLQEQYPQLSKRCLKCFGEFVRCSAKHCKLECMFDSNSDKCRNCSMDHCGQQLKHCSGGFA